jgi:hypothetical protein
MRSKYLLIVSALLIFSIAIIGSLLWSAPAIRGTASLQLMGTEYSPNELATAFLQLKNETGSPINNATCFLTSYYPNKTIFLNQTVMNYQSGSDGLYFYDVMIPENLGVYMLSASCDIPEIAWIDDFNDNAFVENSTNVTISGGKVSLSTVSETIVLSPYVYALYHMNELSGSNVYDSSGNNRNGTVSGSPDWVAGKLNNSFQFNGAGHYMNMSAIANFERTDNFTYEFWFKTSLSTMEMVASKYDTVANKGLMIYLTSGNIWFDFRTAGGYLAVSTVEAFNNSAWHHCAITYDGTFHPAGVRIYVDGISRNFTINKDTLGGSTMNNESFYIGKRSAGNFWNGLLDEFVIYNKTLNATEINYRYNNGTGTESMFSMNATSGFIQSKPVILNGTKWNQFASDYTLNNGTLSFMILDQNNNTICTGLGDISSCANTTTPIKLYAFINRTNNSLSPSIDRWYVLWFQDIIEELHGSSEFHVSLPNLTEITGKNNIRIIS